jgi:hypothetical protein
MSDLSIKPTPAFVPAPLDLDLDEIKLIWRLLEGSPAGDKTMTVLKHRLMGKLIAYLPDDGSTVPRR